MDAAEALILEQGFAGSSVDRLIQAAGVTKGTFFYHFATKLDLAKALVERYAELDRSQLEDNMRRAEKLSRDPLQQLLIFVGLLEEAAAELTEPYPGCLFASYCYESGLFGDEIHGTIAEAMAFWRTGLGAKLREVAERYPPRMDVDFDSLADALTVVFEGAFIVSKTYREASVVAEQLRHYRNYLELLFSSP
ncbi:MAG: TetR/AcrR family transcriptional regulator [Ectothiorhodospiraceae bacterium]|jgi:TetR/AcrR family transcriptional repressor of nem operon